MDENIKCVVCVHTKKMHAIAENHNLKTTHCTVIRCNCKCFETKESI